MKSLLEEHTLNIEFLKPKGSNKPSKILSKTTVSRALGTAVNVENADDMKTLFKSSKVICKNILKLNKWKFTVSFQDFQRPKM